MSLDILGPGSAQNAVTARPAQTTTYGITDTWFKPCSSLTAQDGTQLTADWLNNILAQLRTLVASAGVVQDNGDDMTWRALEVMVPRYTIDSGSAGALVVTNTPPAPSYRPGLTLIVKVNAANPGATTINVDGLGAIPVLTATGGVLPANLLSAGMYALLFCTGADFILLGEQKPSLQANTTLYVNGSTGSDTLYDGTSATIGGSHGPFATIQKALNQIPLFDLNGQTLTIQIADGTYMQTLFCPPQNGTGQVMIIGNHASPANVKIVGSANRSGCFCYNAGIWQWDGVEFSWGGGTPLADEAGDALVTGDAALVVLGNVAFGTAYRAHIAIGPLGSTYVSGFGANLANSSWDGGAAGNITINGDAAYHILSGNGGCVVTNGQGYVVNYDIPGAVSFSGAFVAAEFEGAITVQYGTMTGAANVTGYRYLAMMNGIIWTGGGGANYWPGSLPGYTATGGQYA